MDFTLFGLVPMIFGGAPADTPRALLDAIYQPLQGGEQVNLEAHYSAHLQALVASNLELNAEDGAGTKVDPGAPAIVTFNPFLNGEDRRLDGLAVTEPVIQGDTAVALVSFTSQGQPTTLSVSMVREGEWKVDDIAAVGGGEKWLYSWLLQYDPYNQQ